MFRMIVSAFSGLLLASAATAAEPLILQSGDVIEADFGERLSIQEFRRILRDYGYYSLGPGATYGQILYITAYAYDDKRYYIKAHALSGEVLQASVLRNYWK